MPNKKTITPGDALSVLMEAKGFTEKTLASAIKEKSQIITSIIDGKKELTISLMVKLSNALDTNLAFWLNLQLAHELPIEKKTRQKTIRKARKAKRNPPAPKKTVKKPLAKKPKTTKRLEKTAPKKKPVAARKKSVIAKKKPITAKKKPVAAKKPPVSKATAAPKAEPAKAEN